MINKSFKWRIVVAIAICLAGFSANVALAQTTDCLNSFTLLSNNNSLGNVWSISGGMIITTTSNNNTTATFGGSATLLALPNAGNVFVGWNDGNIQNPRTVTVASDTTFTAMFATCETTGINAVQAIAPMNVYPNPVTNILSVQLEGTLSNSSLAVLDMNGKIALSQPVKSNTVQIDMSALPSGNYILRLNENGKLSPGVKIVKK